MPAVVAPSVRTARGGGVAGISGIHVCERMVDLPRIVEECRVGSEEEESKIRWLASQVVGADSEFCSPFGRRRITYCDHTATGRFLRFIEEYLMTEVLPFYGNTHTEDSYVGLHTSYLVKQANQYIKQCVGASPRDILLFCGSGSTAAIKRLQEVTGIAAPPALRRRLLDSLLPQERWVVFLGPYEHHSNLLSWRQSLAEVVEIGLNDQGKLDLVALEDALKSPKYIDRPKLGSFSACSNVTGVYTDTRAVAILLHRHGAYSCFDFACSGPYAEIDMRSGEEDGYDAIFLSPHKFLGGPGSPGILLMSDDLYRLKGNPPSTSGGGTVLYVNGYSEEETVYCENPEEREDAGTPPIVQKLRAALAFAVKSYVGDTVIRRREGEVAQRVMVRLSGNKKIRVLGEEKGERQPVFSFVVFPGGSDSEGKYLHCHLTSRLLNDLFGIQARGGCACAGPYGHLLLGISREQSLQYRDVINKGFMGLKPGFTRVSFAYFSAPEEVDFVLKAIEFLADYGHRFLHLYEFDWRTGSWDFTGSEGSQPPSPVALRCDEAAPPYEEYFRVAREILANLPERPRDRRPPPEDVDPKLITFMV